MTLLLEVMTIKTLSTLHVKKKKKQSILDSSLDAINNYMVNGFMILPCDLSLVVNCSELAGRF